MISITTLRTRLLNKMLTGKIIYKGVNKFYTTDGHNTEYEVCDEFEMCNGCPLYDLVWVPAEDGLPDCFNYLLTFNGDDEDDNQAEG